MKIVRPLIKPALTLTLALVALQAGCKDEPRAKPRRAHGEQAPSPETPVDTARPGELAEGTEEAFGLRLPREMLVKARFPDAVFAAGSLRLEDVASYVRERVNPERAETGPAKTVLTGARLKAGGPTVLRVEVAQVGGEVSLVVRDETRRPAKEGLTEAERWKEHGLSPSGEVLDPTTLE